jgi:hypothetical protein
VPKEGETPTGVNKNHNNSPKDGETSTKADRHAKAQQGKANENIFILY